MTTIEALVLDARWEAIELLLPHRPRYRGHPAPAIAPRWPASSTRRHHGLLDEFGRQGQLDGCLAVTVARLPDLDPVMMDHWDGRGAAG